ncbi:hypothetical protein [Schlesneria paludicola]|uniref:hypothetical protein n=1 Tax=Schlesneria paludicola TaxID=360056 RepID=UPI00029B22D0|nr:hypothetical protein [Schlesneria paludicola]
MPLVKKESRAIPLATGLRGTVGDDADHGRCDGKRGSVPSRVIRPILAQPPGGKDAARGEWLLL